MLLFPPKLELLLRTIQLLNQDVLARDIINRFDERNYADLYTVNYENENRQLNTTGNGTPVSLINQADLGYECRRNFVAIVKFRATLWRHSLSKHKKSGF